MRQLSLNYLIHTCCKYDSSKVIPAVSKVIPATSKNIPVASRAAAHLKKVCFRVRVL